MLVEHDPIVHKLHQHLNDENDGEEAVHVAQYLDFVVHCAAEGYVVVICCRTKRMSERSITHEEHCDHCEDEMRRSHTKSTVIIAKMKGVDHT